MTVFHNMHKVRFHYYVLLLFYCLRIHDKQTQVVLLPEVVQGPTIISVNLSCADSLQVDIKAFLIPMYY